MCLEMNNRNPELFNATLERLILKTLFRYGFSRSTRKLIRGPHDVITVEGQCSEKLNKQIRLGASQCLKEMLTEQLSIDRADREIERLARAGWNLATIFDSRYPERLRLIDDPPVLIYFRGKLPSFNSLGTSYEICGESSKRPAIGIVGTRKANSFGKSVSSNLAYELTSSGVVVVSGLAKGIDGAAHSGAIKAVRDGVKWVGAGVAVLGAGLNVPYPREHISLAESIVENGGAIISEYSLDTRPHKYNFPERNRIISGLSDAVCVVEAATKSGSIITANLAADQGREVMAFPGRVGDPLSSGTNSLIRNGATLVLGAADVMEGIGYSFLGGSMDSRVSTGQVKEDLFSETCGRILKLLEEVPDQSFDELMCELGDTPQSITVSLSELKRKGAICEMPGELYRLLPKGAKVI